MVDVILAGYNVDAELLEKVKAGIVDVKGVLDKVKQSSGLSPTEKEVLFAELRNASEKLDEVNPDHITPETVPAAYARISRDPRQIPELRAESRVEVEKARKSNANIIFMMGHKSIGNHAMFNFDILKLSRLAVEELQSRRIGCGYTEKSQRYITLEGDYVMPKEFSSEDAAKFKDLVENVQNRFYLDYVDKLIDHHFTENPELAKQADEAKARGVSNKMNRARNTLSGWGKEDARYALGLSAEAQIGTSFTATAMEHAIRTMKYSDLAETRELAAKLFDNSKDLAPSLIWFTDPERFEKQFGKPLEEGYFRDLKKDMKAAVKRILTYVDGKLPSVIRAKLEPLEDVTFIDSKDVDVNIMAAILHTHSDKPIGYCIQAAEYLKDNPDLAKGFMCAAMQKITLFDNPPREFELSQSLMFEVVCSSSCFAQLKRHRIMSWVFQDYDISLGVTIPESITAAGLEPEFLEVCRKSEELYREFRPKYGRAANYCLTNAHKRRVLVGANPRQLNHFARLRCDGHAQWDIRDKGHKMVALAKQHAPFSLLLTCGKDEFCDLKDEIYRC